MGLFKADGSSKAPKANGDESPTASDRAGPSTGRAEAKRRGRRDRRAEDSLEDPTIVEARISLLDINRFKPR